MKTEELEGTALDYWVAKAEGLNIELGRDGKFHGAIAIETSEGPDFVHFEPSADWRQGGLIAHRELISYHPMSDGKQWIATDYQLKPQHAYGKGPTPLIAAMRCYVASKYGDEVPDEL